MTLAKAMNVGALQCNPFLWLTWKDNSQFLDRQQLPPQIKKTTDTLSDFWRALCGDAGVPKIRLDDARHTCGR
jgi:hypothetical protein